MKKIMIGMGLLASLALSGCGEEETRKAIKAIEANGFTDVQITGTPIFGCSDDDNIILNKTFKAKAVNGQEVTGVACAGIFKGWTVRLTF